MSLGLVGVGAYSGVTQEARYETYDREVDLDSLRMIAHPGRSSQTENGEWYGDIAIPANTAYLLLSEQSLSPSRPLQSWRFGYAQAHVGSAFRMFFSYSY